MRKFVLATLAALAIGSAAFAQSADAACWWNGFAWHCSHPHAWWWRHHHPWHAWGYGPTGGIITTFTIVNDLRGAGIPTGAAAQLR